MRITYGEDFWHDNDGNKSFRVSTCHRDFTLAYFDFLDFSTNPDEYTGPDFPQTLLVSGNGTFNNPFYFNFENDPLAKSLVLINKSYLQNKLPMFFENLNSYLMRLTFYNFSGMILKDLNALLEWIDYGNKFIFNPLNFKMVLYLFENSYKKNANGEVEQRKRRSFPIDSLLFNSFQTTFKSMIQFVKYKQLKKTSEIKFALVFTKMDEKQRKRQEDKIWKLGKKKREEAQQINFSVQQQRSHSLFSDYYLDEEEQEKFDQHDRQMSGSQLDLENKEQVGRRRAFSLSVDSTRTLELALSKPRIGCKYSWSRARSFILALNNLLFKNASKPARDNFNIFAFFFAILLSLDLVLMLHVSFHLFRPMSNLDTIGIPLLFIYPLGALLAPVLGILAALSGSVGVMNFYINLNQTVVVFNYSLYLLAQMIFADELYYALITILLIVVKISLSFTGGVIKAHMLNPQFVKNEERLAKMFKQDKTAGTLSAPGGEKSPRSVTLEAHDKASVDSDEDPMKRYKKAYNEETEDA